MELRESLFSLIDGEFLYVRLWNAANKTDASWEVKTKAGQPMSAHAHSSTPAAGARGGGPSECHGGLQQRRGAGLQLERCALKLIPTKRRKKSVACAQHVGERASRGRLQPFAGVSGASSVRYIPCGPDRLHRRDHTESSWTGFCLFMSVDLKKISMLPDTKRKLSSETNNVL